MATSAPSGNWMYLYRLLTLTRDHGTAVVRNLIDDKCSYILLTTLLARNKGTITNLRVKRMITKVQFDLLFPQSGIPTTADFDLTLAICLLRHLKHFGVNSKYTWNVVPQPGDTSLEADLCRLRMHRNELACISSTQGIQETDYQAKWADIEGALLRLNSSVQNPIQNLQQIIDDCKTGPLDPNEETEIQIIQKEKMLKFEGKKEDEVVKTDDTYVLKLKDVHKQDENASLLPVEILRMDKNSIELYKRALSEGQEAVHNIRVMVVGHYGVGKTTLTKRLFGEEVNIKNRESTNGIDVHVRRCKVSLVSRQWKVLDKDQENETVSHRLVKLLKMPVNEARDGDVSGNERTMTHGQKPKRKLKENTHSKKAYVPGTEEEIVDEVPTPFKVESTTLEETAIKSKDESILNYLKELIEQVQDKSAREEDSNTADVSVWDFAGQYVFYATHQVFLSRRAVYLLVTDVSKNMEDIVKDDDCFLDIKGEYHWKISEFVDFWLNSIHEFCSSTESEGPPVVLVGTFADKLNQETRQKTIDEFFYTLRCSLMHKETSRHLAEEDFALDNSILDSNIEMLKAQIFNTAAKQPYWGELIPAKWITLENIIVKLKDEGLKVLHKDKLHDLNKTLPVPIESEAEIDLFLRFHHESGNILYYSDENLNDSIVLDPQWLIDAFKSLITAKMFCCRKPKVLDKWIQFDGSAILTRELVDAVWEKKENFVFHEHVDLLLDYLEKLGFIAKPRLQLDEAEVTDYYVAPCVLKTSPPGHLAPPDCENRRSTSKLCFTTRSRFLPTAVFNKLLAACISTWPLAKERTKPLIFCGCGVFELKDNHLLYMYFFDHIIHIWITKLSAKDSQDQEPDMSLCSVVYVILLDLLQNRFRLASAIQVLIRGQCSDVHSNVTMFTEDELAQNLEVTCSCRTEKHVLRTYELTKYWHFSMTDGQQQVPTDRDLSRIARHIGKEYKSLGFELGLSQAEIEHIEMVPKRPVDMITEMLIKWKEKEENEATLEILTKAMEVVGMDAKGVLQSANITT